MKIFLVLISLISLFITSSLLAEQNYSARMLTDEKGQMILGENIHMQHPLASLTKIMTCLIVLEKIEKKELTLDTKVTISKNVLRIRGSSAYLKPNEVLTIEDLLKAAIIHSGNDSAFALAEFIGGTEADFVKIMNEKSKEWGLKDTIYHSSTGLPAQNDMLDMSTASDLAILTSEVLKYPKYLEFSSMKNATIRDGKTILKTTNKLIGSYDGIDGLKTGFHEKAGYNFIATAKRNNLRFIAILFGCPSDEIRKKEAEALLDKGFNSYEKIRLASKGDFILNISIKNAVEKNTRVILGEDIDILINKNNKDKLSKIAYIEQNLNAPIEQSEKVGVLTIKSETGNIGDFVLLTEKPVKKINFFQKILRIISFNNL